MSYPADGAMGTEPVRSMASFAMGSASATNSACPTRVWCQMSLADEAVKLIREAPLTHEQFASMVLDVLTVEYVVDVIADTVINWDEKTLKDFVKKWKEITEAGSGIGDPYSLWELKEWLESWAKDNPKTFFNIAWLGYCKLILPLKISP